MEDLSRPAESGISVMFSQLGFGFPRLEFLGFESLEPWGHGGFGACGSLEILKFGDLGLLGLRRLWM